MVIMDYQYRKEVRKMNVTNHTIDRINDPTGILAGDRYEIILQVDVEAEDELFSEEGIYIKLIFAVDENASRIAQYQVFESNTNKYLEFSLEDEELEELQKYCSTIINN